MGVFRNKLDELGNVVRNKIRLVTQDYNQIERIDFEKTFALMAQLETIQMTLTYASFKYFELFQMSV